MNVRICTNCIHCKEDEKEKYLCEYNQVIDLVAGKTNLRSCKECREDHSLCGREAMFFEEVVRGE